jgi:hypothetical protein
MPFYHTDVSDENIALARQMRAERDRLYGNLFEPVGEDMRWVGDLGEIYFNEWIRGMTDLQVEWIRENVAGKPDFKTGTRTTDVKTVKRQVEPRLDYTAQISAEHAREKVDYFFFTCYHFACRRIYMLGGIEKGRFLELARYYEEGERVHENYVAPHPIYNIGIDQLLPPEQWVRTVECSQ